MAIRKCKQGKTHTPKIYVIALDNGTAIYGDRNAIARQWQGLTVHPEDRLPIGDESHMTDRNAMFECWQNSSDYMNTINACIAEGDIVGSKQYRQAIQSAFSDWLIVNH